MSSPPRRQGPPDRTLPDLDPEKTRLSSRPPSPDDQPTGAIADLGIVAELRAALTAPGPNDRQVMPLYAMPDAIVVGRGTACDWQLDDASLSRKHAQFRWSGMTGELTVEDLGSANGTRVNGRAARAATVVRPGEPVQLGTVIITLTLKRVAHGSPDDQATRLVPQPDAPSEEQSSEPSLTPLPPAPTVVRPQPQRGPANPRAQVFRPERDAARPDEPTRSWDPRAVLVRAPDKAFDPEWLDQLKHQWRTNRRPLVLAGAAAWIAILLIVWSSLEKPQPEDDPFANVPSPATSAPARTGKTAGAPGTPVVTKLDTPSKTNDATAKTNGADAKTNGADAKNIDATAPNRQVAVEATHAQTVNGSGERSDEATGADQLERAIAAYDQGHLTEALVLFRQLAADPKNAAAKFMVDLIESRQGATP